MYDSPLRIFTIDQLERISFSSLKDLKKEILLEFQFSSKSSAKINGHLIDKNTVLLIFDELEDRLHPYLIIENTPKLKSFFQNGNLEFLRDDEANQCLSEIIHVYDSIGLKVANILAKRIRKECKSHTLESIIEISFWNVFLRLFSRKKTIDPKKHSIQCENIKLITAFSEKLSATNHKKTFDLAYIYLQDRIANSRDIIIKSTSEDNYFEFMDGLEVYFNMGFINLFDVLPSHFEDLASLYTQLCKITFVDPWIDDSLTNLGLYQLSIISAAANTVSKRHTSNKIDKFNTKLDLKYWYSQGCAAYFILFFIVLFTIISIILIIK